MNTTKELAAVGSSPSSSAKESKPTVVANECCMCGDYGITNELYRCNLCSFRSQHRYCSNLYPKAETYELCNWCLRKDDGSNISTGHHEQQTSDKRSSSQSGKTIMIKNNNPVRLKIQLRRCNSQILNNNNNNNNDPVKKQRCLERLSSSSSLSSPSSSGAGRKNNNNNKTMTISNATEESESLIRRTKSEDISNSSSSSAGVVKQVFRGKARRYKLLEEVSS